MNQCILAVTAVASFASVFTGKIAQFPACIRQSKFEAPYDFESSADWRCCPLMTSVVGHVSCKSLCLCLHQQPSNVYQCTTSESKVSSFSYEEIHAAQTHHDQIHHHY